MGIVVAATHLELDQQVAIKFLLPEAMRNPEVVERFLREAKVAAKVKSEHVARVRDVGRVRGEAGEGGESVTAATARTRRVPSSSWSTWTAGPRCAHRQGQACGGRSVRDRAPGRKGPC